MQKEKLYKRDNTGATRIWWAEVNQERYRLHSGQLDGKIVTSDWTVCEAKNVGRSNATTGPEQARSEVDSLYTKKKKRGYTEDPKAIDKVKKAMIGVMLAHDYEDHKKKLEYPHVYCQPKLDGIRCIARPDGLWTRKGERITTVPHIEEAILPLCAHLNYVFDGELYNHDLKDDFNEIASLVRRQKSDEKQRAKVRDIVQYHIYDLVDQKRCYNNRKEHLRDIFTLHNIDTDIVVRVKTRQCDDEEELNLMYDTYLSKGYEGQMVRMDRSYEFKRTPSLLKRKEFQDEEFEIRGMVEGKGNRSGMVGAISFQTREGKDFSAALMGTDEYRRYVWKNKDSYLGLAATVKYFHKTPDGIPRFPVVKALDESK